MYYTVISKSGWQNDCWHVQKTFTDKGNAQAYKDKIHQRTDATQDHYKTAIKAHRKKISQLLTDGDVVKFSDGTWAAW